MQQHFYKTKFAQAGDVTAIPDAAQPDGSMSYTEGYGFDYERDPATDAAAKRISRDQANQLYKDMTDNIREYQIAGFPEFIVAADNGGVAFPYPINAYVRFDVVGDGSGWEVFCSLVNNNTATPADATKWALSSPLTVASILATQTDVNEGDDDTKVVGPLELVEAAREGRWIFAGAATYATAVDLTVALPGSAGFTLVAGAQVGFTVPGASAAGPLTFKWGGNAAKPLRTSTGDELLAGDLIPTSLYTARYTGNDWRLETPVASQLQKYGGQQSGGIFGLQPSNSGGALNTAINVSVGACRDSTNAALIALGVPMTKRIDLAFAAGSGNGMRDTGALAANQTWHLFVIENPVTQAVDVLASQSPTAPVLPAGFTLFRRFWSIMLDAASNIRQFVAIGDYCEWNVPQNDYAGTANAGISVFTLRKISVPAGILTRAKIYFQSTDVGGNPDANAYLSGLYSPLHGVPAAFGPPTQWAQIRRGWFYAYPGAWNSYATEVCDVWTDTAQNIYTGSNDAFDVIAVKVLGYLDQRNQFF